MNNTRRNTIAAGALYILSYIGVFAGAGLLEGMINSPDSLSFLADNDTKVVVGVLLELLNGAAVLGIAAALYPVLNRWGAGMAMAYVGIRIVEAVSQVLVSMPVLSMLTLSKEYIGSGEGDRALFELQEFFLHAQRSAGNTMILVFFALGAVLFYALLYRSKLVPRWLSVWGLVGVVMVVLMNVLGMDLTVGWFFAMPIILNELFLAGWLLIRGFDKKALAEG